MESSSRIYVVLSTILILEASGLPYFPYSNQRQGYYAPHQWSAPRPDYTDNVQSGYLQHPTQDWVSRGYQRSGYDPKLYGPAPAPTMYQHSPLGYPVRSLQSNSYGSAMSSTIGDSHTQQQLLPQSQPVQNNDDPSKFQIFHLPLSNSPSGKTIKLPITGDKSRFKVFNVNQGAKSQAEPSRTDDDVSTDVLESLSRAKLEIENIESNSGGYRETEYFRGNQQIPQQVNSNSKSQGASSATSSTGGGSYPASYLPDYGIQGGSYSQRIISNSDSQASAVSNSGNLGTGYSNGEPYMTNTANYLPNEIQGVPHTQRGTSNSNAQSNALSKTGNLGTGNGELYLGDTYPQNNKAQGGAPTQRIISNSDAQASAVSNSGSLGTGYSNGEKYLTNPANYLPNEIQGVPHTQQGTSNSMAQSNALSNTGNLGTGNGELYLGDTYPQNNKAQGGAPTQRIISNSDAQASAVSNSGSLGTGYSNGEKYLTNPANYLPNEIQGVPHTQQGTSNSNAQSNALSNTGNLGTRNSELYLGDTYPQNNKAQGGAPTQRRTSNSDTQASALSNSGNLGTGYSNGESYLTNPANYFPNYKIQGGSYTQQGTSNSIAQSIASSNPGNLSTGNGELYLGNTYPQNNKVQGEAPTQQRTRNNDAQASALSNSGNIGTGYSNGEPYSTNPASYLPSYETQDGSYSQGGTSNSGAQANALSNSGNRGTTYNNDDSNLVNTYPQIYGNQGGSYTHQGTSNSNVQSNALSSPGNLGKGNGKLYLGDTYPQNNKAQVGVTTQRRTSNSDAQTNAFSNSENLGTGHNNGELYSGYTYPLNYRDQGEEPTRRGNSYSDAQANNNASSNTGNLGTEYNSGKSYPANTYPQNYNQGTTSTQQGTGYSDAQATASGLSDSRSPSEGYNDDKSYPVNSNLQSNGNQDKIYNNGKYSLINNSNQQNSQNLNPNNDESYSVKNNNLQDYGNKDVALNSDSSSRSPINSSPYYANSNNLNDSKMDNQALNSGKSNLSNNNNGHAPVYQDESPNNAETYVPTTNHDHVLVNSPSKPVSTSKAQATTTTGSQSGPKRTHQIAPHYRHHQYPHNSPHRRPYHGPSTNQKLIQPVASFVSTDAETSGPADYLPDSSDGDYKNTQSELSDLEVPANPYYDGIGIQPESTKLNPTDSQGDEIITPTDDQYDWSNISYPETGSGSLVPDSLASIIPKDTVTNRGSSTSNSTKKTKTSSLFNILTDNIKPELATTSISALPTDVSSAGNYDSDNGQLSDFSPDLFALLGLNEDTASEQDILKSLQNLEVNTDNIDKDDARNPAIGTLSNDLSQGQATVLGGSKATNISSSSGAGSASYQAEYDEYSNYKGPLRVLVKIIAILEKLFGGHEKNTS